MLHDISWHDLEFERIPVECHSTAGVPYTRWVKVGMPRIPQNVINGVFYLYADRADAETGRNPAGTGFIVRYDGIRNESVAGQHFYGVTNWHVACKRGLSTIRLNKKDGGIDVIELGPEDWHFLPGMYDVAVVPLSLDDSIHDVSSVGTQRFTPKPSLRYGGGIGVGEDVFMIGLFIDYDWKATNIPSARFGNISMMENPQATIKQPTGYRGESYVVDMHSRTGFSGSPVYVYRTFGSDLTPLFGTEFDDLEITNFDEVIGRMIANGQRAGRMRGRIHSNNLFQLLGIHWGQFPETWELKQKSEIPEARRDLIVEGGYVEGMSGMTCVIPAWQILEVLNMPVLSKLRRPEIVAAEKARASEPKAESAPEPADDANPNHLADFTRLVDVAARKRPQDDQT
jgi:hypothetical protein